MSRKTWFTLICILMLALPPAVTAQLGDTPWPKFHKDLRNTGRTLNSGTRVGKLKWKFVTGGAVTSSPILDNNGILYVGSADNNFYAINTETGALEWKYETGAEINRCTPAIDQDGVVYIGSYDGYLYAFDTASIDPLDPEPLWKFNPNSPSAPYAAIDSSPTIDSSGNIIFANNDGYIYSVTPGGSLNWKTFIGSSWVPPAIDESNDQIYVGAWDVELCSWSFFDDNGTLVSLPSYYNFYALDIGTGAINWFSPCSNNCAPGGILAGPVISPDGGIIISYMMTWDVGNWAACEWDSDNLWDHNIFISSPNDADGDGSGEILGRLNLDGESIYSTPAMLPDNSFYVAVGPVLRRILPDFTVYYELEVDGERIESSPAIDGEKLIYVGSNGGYFYCVCADCPETPLLWQYPRDGEDPLMTEDGVTIASVISSPAIGDDDRHSLYVGASDGKIYSFYDGARIYGTVQLVDESGGSSTKTPLRAVMLTLTSEFTDEIRITYSDTNGYYEFAGVENYTYTIVPEKIGYVFTPADASALVTRDQDVAVNFEAFDGFTVSGTIEDADGTLMSGVAVTLEGLKTSAKSTTTDGSGKYTFTGLSFDTYTVTPTLSDYGFTPPFQEVIISTAASGDKTGIDFVATFGYQISGKVTDFSTQTGISSVSVTIEGVTNNNEVVSENTTTASDGAYSFVGLSSGSYTITPVLIGFDFEPSDQSITVAGSNVDSINFVAASGVSISGAVLLTDSGDNASAIVQSVELILYKGCDTLLGDEVTTVSPDENGSFVFIGVPENQRYTLIPTLSGYGFEPMSYCVEVGDSDLPYYSFRAAEGLYISGKVTDFLRQGIPNVPIMLCKDDCEQTEDTIETSKGGSYSFIGLDPGEYIVMPDPESFKAYPLSEQSITLTDNEENVNFVVNSVCTVASFNLPPIGGSGTLVNVYGYNFGWNEPKDNETVSVSDGDGEVPLTAGVYFGNDNPETWAKADVVSWSNFKIVVEAPAMPEINLLPIFRVWVVRSRTGEDTNCSQIADTNLFMYIY